jgi:hypothetical protein
VVSEPGEAARVRELLGVELSEHEVEGLLGAYEVLARAVAAFATEELRAVEPALRSIPGPPWP